jgi:hypothetical protein
MAILEQNASARRSPCETRVEELIAKSKLLHNFRPLQVVADPVFLLVAAEGSGSVYQNRRWF